MKWPLAIEHLYTLTSSESPMSAKNTQVPLYSLLHCNTFEKLIEFVPDHQDTSVIKMLKIDIKKHVEVIHRT